MSTTTVRRVGVITASAAAAVAMTATSASAHHCFVPMYTLTGPTSANWFVVSAEMGRGSRAMRRSAPERGTPATRHCVPRDCPSPSRSSRR